MGHPRHGIATDTDAGGLADACAGELPNRFVGKRAASGDDTDIAFLVNVPGRNADAAAAGGLIPSPGVTMPGQLGPISLVSLASKTFLRSTCLVPEYPR